MPSLGSGRFTQDFFALNEPPYNLLYLGTMKPFYIHTGGMKKEIAIEIIIKLLNKKLIKKELEKSYKEIKDGKGKKLKSLKELRKWKTKKKKK